MKKYNNPRLEKYYPVEGDTEFFKFAVMDGNEIAQDKSGKSLIFQDEQEAQNIVDARLKVNHKIEAREKIESLKKKCEEDIQKIEKELTIKLLVPNISKFSIFSDFISFKATTKEDIKEIISFIKPNRENLKDDNIKDYDYNFKLSIDNPAKNGAPSVSLRYKNDRFKSVWIQFDTALIDEYLVNSSRRIYSSEYHYFPGTSQKDLDNMRVRCKNFKASNLFYFGGGCQLKDTKVVKEIIEKLIA